MVSDLKCDSNYTYCYEDILGEYAIRKSLCRCKKEVVCI